MSQEDTGAEKSFDPTPQRLAEARKRGDVAKSNDVTVAATYLGLLAAAVSIGAFALDRAGSVLMIFIGQPDRLEGLVLGPGGGRLLGGILTEALIALAPIFLVPIAAVLVSLFAQQAIAFATEKLKPKASRLSIVQNAKQKFGPTGLVEFAKTVVKLSAVSATLFFYISSDLNRMIGAAQAEAKVVGALMMETFIVLLAVTAVIAVAIGGIDIVWQRFDHARKLKMSFQEMKEENRQSEGDPHMKAQRRARAEAIASNRMLLDVPKADVVVVNPTHYAVALRWSRGRGTAPVCVAKGTDEMALSSRAVAGKAGIPIHSDPPTARALHATVGIGEEIRPEHYRAVAAAIRFADRMDRAARARGGRVREGGE